MNLLSGLGNHLESEALPGVLPVGQNSPQQVARGLYAEQLSGTAFTAPRHRNLKTWLYKIRPSVVQSKFEETGHATWITDPGQGNFIRTPEALRFQPFPHAAQSKDFLESLFTYAMNGSPFTNTGCALHLYAFNRSMERKHLYNADAEMMIVPETGTLMVRTELGVLEVAPRWIAVIPRGMKFRVDLAPGSTTARGYVCENFGAPFQLPELGPIGANGLANPSDFEVPRAAYEQVSGEHELFGRYQGSLWRTVLEASPLDTVAWRGNYVPYRYDLGRFNTINTVSFDHPDPSIFTVLTSPSAVPGTANVDFVIFPPRWMVAEHTFRPPYYHRNVMNEFMGLITGKYDAKEEGFLPGGASLHNAFTGHGPDADAFRKATDVNAKLEPVRYENTLAFMWESQYPFWPSEQAMKRTDLLDRDYRKCWEGLKPGLEG